MALQDLVISQTKISEELIEHLLKGKIQLIEENNEVHLLPSTKNYSNPIRVLLYLCGKKAWSLLKNEEVLTPIVELSNNLGIKGNTLRPILKSLRDDRLVESKSGQYYVLPTGITYLEQPSEDYKTGAAHHVAVKRKQADKSGKAPKTKKLTGTKGVGTQLRNLLEKGFFNEGKGLTEIQEMLAKKAVKVSLTSLPSYVINLVRKGLLDREKEKRGKKIIWIYKTSSNR